ncbi:hypothetical protein MUDAN_DOGOELCO_00982 [Lactiplantibacillus mudanjiangensis]|nr:hypothetical protein MUDAN_DOGOELCO_00982 [Lactiplantibacillus mudanjiangensis]
MISHRYELTAEQRLQIKSYFPKKEQGVTSIN